ncbi:MAG: thioredoxin domain-containing protein, partial [bacterium]|nr:thioredoxin domain-containing protein [bacterium]
MSLHSNKIILAGMVLAAILGGAIFILERRKTPNIAALFAGQAQNAILENQDNVEAGSLFAYDEAGASVSNMAQDYLAKQKAPEEDSGYEEVGQQSSSVAGVSIDQIATDDDPFWGLPGANVTIVSFSDFLCPYCAEFALTTLPQIKKQYASKVKFIFRDLPNENSHPGSNLAHQAGECANVQGKFWEMHDKIFQNSSRATESNLKLFAKSVGLDSALFDACLASGEKAAETQADLQDGLSAGVSSTPTLFVNNQKIEGLASFAEISGII